MDERYLQILEHKGENYAPLCAFGAWRVALLNTHARFRRENLTQLERHVLTDEVFVLLKGEAALYVADGDAKHAGHITVVPLEAGKVYNVRQGVWHAVETGEGTSVLVVENDDTSPANSPKIAVPADSLPVWQRGSTGNSAPHKG